MWEIVSMILKQKAEYSKEPKDSFILEALPDLSFIKNLPSPRLLNTHLPYRWLPNQHIENGGKIVHVLRNPKDVCVSLYHHAKISKGFGEIGDFGTFFDKVFMNPKGKAERQRETNRQTDHTCRIINFFNVKFTKDFIFSSFIVIFKAIFSNPS